MADNKTLNNRMNIRYFEEEYNTQKMIFLIENPEKTERNFVESKIEQFNQLELEERRKCDLADDEVYNEIKKTKRYITGIENNYDKKSMEEYLEREFTNHRQKYIFKEKREEGIRSKFYIAKLKGLPNTKAIIQNKSLLFDGKALNLLERYKIADKVFGIDKKIRTLNIAELEKYQLLAYILGCDKDNARNLMNGCYKSKSRDLSTYFNNLDLNK
ncbi:hypothetical protein [Flavobacterium sp. XS2P14]|uniref:hypothetical protein n=1 Tax=Flavobacterium sp. XS2P14 TaxID=3401735 RepID=UPI003AAEA4DD